VNARQFALASSRAIRLPANVERCEVFGTPDELGRVHYALSWWDDYFPGHPEGENVRRLRGQHFYGVLPEGLESVTEAARA
jgi:hypothetical protein